MEKDRNQSSSGINEAGVMLSVFDPGPYLGKKIHIWKRNYLPNAKTVLDISYEAWETFKKYINDTLEIDESASFSWFTDREEAEDQLVECIHLKNGQTIFFTGYDTRVELISDYKCKPKITEDLYSKLKKLKRRRENDEIGFLTKDHAVLEVRFCKYRQYEKNVIPYLGDDIHSFYKNTVEQLKNDDNSGLYLLFGEPGTGKTSFIKQVISEVNKKTIFVTPTMAEYLSSPDLLSLLSDYKDSILVIEDAEKILMKREGDNSNAVSTILNLTDGFPADFFNLNIICTFNTEISEIDPALMRKGRLKGLQKFSKLSPKIANGIAKKLGIKTKTETATTLAEICNVDQPKYLKSKYGIGFKVE